MKILKSMLLCVFTLFVFTACNSSSSDSNTGGGGGNQGEPVPDAPTHLIGSTGKGLYTKSLSGGEWTLINGTDDRAWNTVSMLSDKTLLAYAANIFGQTGAAEGIYRSADGGNTWAVSPNTQDVRTYDFLELSDGTVVTTSKTEILTSGDKGSTWVKTYSAPGTQTIYSPIHKLSNGNLLVITSPELYKYVLLMSADNGKTWASTLNAENISLSNILSTGSLVFLTGSDSTDVTAQSKGVVYKSTDSGKTWVSKSVSGTNTGNLFGGLVRFGDGTLYITPHWGGSKMWKSSDNGDTWQEYSLDYVSTIFCFIFISGKTGIITGTPKSGELSAFRTTDSGATWKGLTDLIETKDKRIHNEYFFDGVFYIVYHLENNREVWKSSDLGATWAKDSELDVSYLYLAPIIK